MYAVITRLLGSLIIATPLDWHGIRIGIIVWLHKYVVTNEIYAWVWLKDFILKGEMYYMFQHRSPKKVGKLYVNQMPVAESQFKVEVVELSCQGCVARLRWNWLSSLNMSSGLQLK